MSYIGLFLFGFFIAFAVWNSKYTRLKKELSLLKIGIKIKATENILKTTDNKSAYPNPDYIVTVDKATGIWDSGLAYYAKEAVATIEREALWRVENEYFKGFPAPTYKPPKEAPKND